MGSTTATIATTATPLDSTGAIHVKDPFSACHADSYDIMANLGVKVNRKDITWSDTERGDDNWYWDTWDARIAGLKAKNMTALPILDYGNLAVQTGTTRGNRIYTEHDIQEWIEYVNMCIERYYEHDSHYTKYWELWNEPNLGDFNADSGFWTGTDAEYFALQKRTAANISARWPDVQLVSAGISGYDPVYLDAMFAAGAMENVDILAFHPYSGSNYDNLDAKINDVKGVCQKWNFTGPIWITEVGWPTEFRPTEEGFEAVYQARLELQATIVPKIYCLALANGIEHVTYYCLGDSSNFTYSEENFGLVFWGSNPYKPVPYENDTLKPSGFTYKVLAHHLNWSTYYPRGVQTAAFLPSAPRLKSFYFLEANGNIVLVCWNANGDITTPVRFTMPATGVQVFSGPSYKPGTATNYHLENGTSGITVSAMIDNSPVIFLIDMPDGASPVTILLESDFTFYDLSLLVIIPGLIALCVVVFLMKFARVKPMGSRKAVRS
nr:hypothetical protein [Candidatus Sigynarchaeota archaeon]